MARIVKQEYIVTNPFDEKLAIEALYAQLRSQIFSDLINGEKAGIKLVFTLETVETEQELYGNKEAAELEARIAAIEAELERREETQ